MRPPAQHSALATVIRTLAVEKDPACLLDARGVFLFVNDAWERHATSNGGTPACLGDALIGTNWLDHIRGEEVREFHAELLARALRRPGPHPRPILQVGEVNTPTTAALTSTRLEPVMIQAGEPVAVAIHHTLVRERPIEDVYDVVDRPLEAYRDASGEIVQCSCCRRFRDPADPERWDLVPKLLTGPAPAEQKLCPLCSELHYGCPVEQI
jgi:hypothetical protein